ncbi:SAM-dependent methyltransferase [Tersicoccus solisilvae]|uniref:SAM-dependent methyltransferase n=1 Tax=Tersicoccus solisilvae TaxID=1882339 RepID=A0ABQ1NL35_9MICC|nr:class I SAM-dependent methyltransferase [Tersicoccus solisilvae]GGC79864.1 SAM-dependent methyltransferase [Tersicoccus solisilvae]
MTPTTRWDAPENAVMRRLYERRFRGLHADGVDLDGEGRLLDALLERKARVLDAGCGTGRLAAHLTRQGHRAVGVDKDAALVRAARELQGASVPFLEADLAELDAAMLARAGLPEAFDAVAAIGNVLVFAAPGSERGILERFRALLPDGGLLLTGFATDRDYTVADLDRNAAAAGFALRHRFATYQLAPFTVDAGWAVSIFDTA